MTGQRVTEVSTVVEPFARRCVVEVVEDGKRRTVYEGKSLRIMQRIRSRWWARMEETAAR